MEEKPVIYAWIFARGGSKGLPRKNIKILNGRPLIAYAAEVGLQSKWIDKVFLSTDDAEIAEVARAYGIEVPFMRPAELASDHAPERLTWKHAVEWTRQSTIPAMDVMVSLPCTSPLRTVREVDRGIEKFLSGGCDTVISVSRSAHHPSFNVVTMQEDGAVCLVHPPDQLKARRQDFKPVYDINTAFYITAPEFVMQTDSIWEGRVAAIEIPVEHAVDIDGELDFAFAEFLLQRKQEKR